MKFHVKNSSIICSIAASTMVLINTHLPHIWQRNISKFTSWSYKMETEKDMIYANVHTVHARVLALLN